MRTYDTYTETNLPTCTPFIYDQRIFFTMQLQKRKTVKTLPFKANDKQNMQQILRKQY